MSPQMLLIFSPFLAVLYVLFGLLQALRKKHQGFFAALLAFLTVALTIAAYVVTTDPLTKARLTQFMLLNAGIAFIGSLLMLLLERRDSERDSNRSYGMVGLGVSILMALGIFAAPLLSGALANSAQGNAAANNLGTGTLQAVRNFTPGADGQNTAESTQAADTTSGEPSPLAQALTAQTGLTTDDLTTQVTNGSTIAQLVSAHNGDLKAVTAAIVNALDQLTAAGSQGAQFLSRLGSDNAAIADSIVQGQLPAQIQPRILAMLITGEAPSFGGGGGFGGNGTGGGGFAPPQPTAEPTQAVPTEIAPAQAAPNSDSQVAQILSDQTGLSADDLNTQITSGSTLAQLVSAHNGDLNAVTSAIAGALDQLVTAGGRTGQLVSRLGSDNTAIATQLVQGDLPAQVQQRVVSMLITGAAPSTPGDGTGSGDGTPPPPGGDTNSGASNTNQSFPPPTNVPPTATTLPPTATVARPTPISFPTATDTPAAAQTEAQATVAATSSAAACTLIPNYNLNLRDQPNKDTGAVLVSIPLGMNVSADQRTSDGWYHLTYDGHTGWVDGQFASPSAGCSTLPLATPTS